MSNEIITTLISVGATSLISVIGFWITNTSLKKSFRNELQKNRDNVFLGYMSAIPLDILELLDEMMEIDNSALKNKRQKEQNLKSFKKIINTTYSYGSEEAIKLLALMQKENYAAAKDNVEQDIYRMIAIYCLAATQIKFDVTGIAVSPNFWFQMRLNDYSEHQEKYRIATNILIKELELNKKFKL
ncbi:hypothetical protein ACQCTK_00150 [Streptococcus milleri]